MWIRWVYRRFEREFKQADLPAPRPPQTNTLPLRRSTFSALSRSLSKATGSSKGGGGEDGGSGSVISWPIEIKQSSEFRG